MPERGTPGAVLPVLCLVLLAASGCGGSGGEGESRKSLEGTWRAVLATPGGDLPFLLEFQADGAVARNGLERVPFTSLAQDGSRVVLRIDGYDSRIEAVLGADGRRMIGAWTRTRPGGEQDRLAFRAERGETRRFLPPVDAPEAVGAPLSVSGVWAATFRDEEGEEPARGEFTQEGSRVTGTFLTPAGDYRFLAGDYRDGLLRLSCFDGAHAFLFRAAARGDTLTGDFWSRGSYHATWSARRIDPAKEGDGLPDPFGMVGLTHSDGRLRFSFPDLDGRPVSLSDPRFAGRVVLVSLFGSWCPNCNDEAPLLVQWHRRYRDRGLEIVGLAYEFTGNAERDRRFVRSYGERYGIEFPLLLAGTSDKAAASASLPDLTGVLAYPTTIFVGRDGKVRKIHSGFAGPATGEHHRRMVAELEAVIESLLAEPAPPGAL